jgi:hypothetical protein
MKFGKLRCSHDAIPEKLGLFWNDTAFESAPFVLPWVKKFVFESAKRLSLLKTQAFVAKDLTITCAGQAWQSVQRNGQSF